jgi:hypothetical protein
MWLFPAVLARRQFESDKRALFPPSPKGYGVADGAIYPRPFVFVDQIYLVLLACGHAQQMIARWRELER